jgi:acyl phosphate:glycerol-3-phosphate acyltransferase
MEIIVALFSYLIGSIPTGFIIGKLAGIDVRTAGSGNIGATNVARVMGKGRGLLTLLADVAKGFVPVFAAQQMAFSDTAVAVIAGAAFLGHLYPIFLKFRGGKGVATAFGALLAVAPQVTLILIAVFIFAALPSRIISLGSLGAALAAPILFWFFSYPAPFVALTVFLAAMIVIRHRANIKRLLDGAEPRFGARTNSR